MRNAVKKGETTWEILYAKGIAIPGIERSTEHKDLLYTVFDELGIVPKATEE